MGTRMMNPDDIDNKKYKFVPPEGGWGYLITASVVLTHITTIVPTYGFGLIFGEFLTATGDETNGTTLTSAAFLSVSSFTGLVSSYLLRKYTYRKVAFAGSIIYSIGAIGTIFIQDLTQLIITYGVLQGFGFGLIMPSVFSALNVYFETKLNLMMGIAQTSITITTMLCAPTVAYLVETFGFRKTLVGLALYSLLNIPAVAALQPVEWHMKRFPVGIQDEADNADFKRELSQVVLQRQQMENLLEISKGQETHEETDVDIEEPDVEINETERREKSNNFDLSLLKDAKYLNMVVGISLAFNSDVNFIAILRMVLHNLHFEVPAIALAMTVHFCSDLVSRICFSVISALVSFRSRYVFLAGSFLSALFRIAFTLRDDLQWKLIILGILGFLRCLIQTTFPLVISEKYKENFSTAFSLYMVVCGVISLIFGPLLSYVKAVTQNDVMIIHVLTAACLVCSFTWTVELVITRFSRKK
ncbi:unnamed protein product [Phaedon cochleariae]|uniref:Monocarboxylate transporter n=1 Tax=Phaedon cochleariae TaxID=80249 RepID=A0A9P0D8U3_PHACE|nr:unnamed protein product [Phaedon cochleariae]